MAISAWLIAWMFWDHAVLAAYTGQPMQPFWKLKIL